MYGVLGTGSAPTTAIVASLNDIGKDQHFFIPWYGKVTPGLEALYDWMLDNNIEFTLVQDTSIKKAPAVLRTMASQLVDDEDVSRRIIKMLKPERDHALILWDEEDEELSVDVAGLAIDNNLPTLELTNGLVPIVFNEQEGPTEIVEEDNDFLVEDAPTNEIENFTREELEIMPAAVVKRVAANKGFDPKTKDEAIDNLTGAATMDDVLSTNRLTIQMDDVMARFDVSAELIKKIFDLVVLETNKV